MKPFTDDSYSDSEEEIYDSRAYSKQSNDKYFGQTQDPSGISQIIKAGFESIDPEHVTRVINDATRVKIS